MGHGFYRTWIYRTWVGTKKTILGRQKEKFLLLKTYMKIKSNEFPTFSMLANLVLVLPTV